MGNAVYNIAKEKISKAQLDLSTANLWLMLSYGYVPSVDGDSYVSSVAPFEVTGDAYTRVKLANVSLTRDTVNNRMVLKADNITWNQANFQADGAVIFVDTGDDATAMLVTFLDFGQSMRSNFTPFSIEWSSAEGILNIR
jgi:hypothetical protein